MLERTLNVYKNHGFGDWTIFEKSNPNRVIGFGGVFYSQFDGRKTNNLGYRFEPEAWGKGYATEAANACLEVAKKHGNVQCVFATADVQNKSSLKILKKIGFLHKGQKWCEDTKQEEPYFEYMI